MDNNQKKFNLFVFLSTFARNLIETFIPIILYKFGYSLNEIIFYYLIVNGFSLLITYPCMVFSKKFDNKILAIIGMLNFITLQIMINHMIYSIWYIIVIAILFAIYRRGYWISRRFYNLKVIPKTDVSKSYSWITIINQLGLITSAYMGALLLDSVSVNIVTFIAMVLFLLSIVPLYMLNFKYEKSITKIQIFKTIKKIPFQNLYIFGSYELLNIVKFFFPLYLFIYVKNSYQVVGLLNLLANLATIVFVYFYGRMVNGKKNFLKESIVLTAIIYILEANTTTVLLILLSFLEGIARKMYDISISKEFYKLSKKFEYENYNSVYEFIQNLFRFIVVLIIFMFCNNIKTMIYIPLLFNVFGAFLSFKQLNTDDYDMKNEYV